MPSSVFAPPLAPAQAGDDDQEIAVERSTRAIRIANQFRDARAPEPTSRTAGARVSITSPSSTTTAAPRRARSNLLILVSIAIAALGIVAMLLR